MEAKKTDDWSTNNFKGQIPTAGCEEKTCCTTKKLSCSGTDKRPCFLNSIPPVKSSVFETAREVLMALISLPFPGRNLTNQQKGLEWETFWWWRQFQAMEIRGARICYYWNMRGWAPFLKVLHPGIALDGSTPLYIMIYENYKRSESVPSKRNKVEHEKQFRSKKRVYLAQNREKEKKLILTPPLTSWFVFFITFSREKYPAQGKKRIICIMHIITKLSVCLFLSTYAP